MKDDFHALHAIELHALELDCDIASDSNCCAATDQDISAGAKPVPPTEHENINNQLPYPLFDRPKAISGHTSPIQFWHTPTHLQSKNETKTKTTSEAQHTTGSAGLDWKMEEDWEDSCQIPP